MRKVTKSDCAGCRNDFYNGNNTLTAKECWSFKDATLANKLDIHIDQPPPYRSMKPTTRPICYETARYVRVDPANLTKEGFWK